MIDNVIQFPSTSIQGEYTCLSCGHKWQAVAPFDHCIGAIALECPKCGLEKGFPSGEFNYPDEEHYQCECGSFYFGITRCRVYCINCGKNHQPYD